VEWREQDRSALPARGLVILLVVMWLMVKLDAEQLSPAALQIREGWQRGPREACAGAKYHDSTLLRFRMTVEKSLVTPEKVTLYG
jgi:hypothetical protein